MHSLDWHITVNCLDHDRIFTNCFHAVAIQIDIPNPFVRQVTEDALEEQLLAHCVNIERPALEIEKNNLVRQQNQFALEVQVSMQFR